MTSSQRPLEGLLNLERLETWSNTPCGEPLMEMSTCYEHKMLFPSMLHKFRDFCGTAVSILAFLPHVFGSA